MDGRKGEKSSQTGAVLMMSSAILLALSMIILDILKISPPPIIALVSTVSEYIHVDDMLPMKVLIPLSFVSYVVWRIVRYISLELYLNN